MPVLLPDAALPQQLMKAQHVLNLTQNTLGKLLGASRRTAGRWQTGRSTPAPHHLHALARAVHPHDRDLAAAIANQTGYTLVALGLEAAPAPPKPPPPPAPPPRAFPPIPLMVEAIVCAAVETLDAKPPIVRDVLRVAFHRARVMGLTLEEIDDALSPPPAPVAKTSAATKGR